MIVLIIILCFIILLNNSNRKNNYNRNNSNINNRNNRNNSNTSSNNNNTLNVENFETLEKIPLTSKELTSNDINEELINNDQNKGLKPIEDTVNLNVKIVRIAKDYNGIQVSFLKQSLINVKYYLHVYRLNKDGEELDGQGSYLLVGLDPTLKNGRLVSNPIPIQHPKAKKFIIALQYTYENDNGDVNHSEYKFPTNLISQTKIFTLNRPIEDQVAEYKKFENYLEQKEEIEKSKLIKEENTNRIMSNADGTFNMENIEKSLGGFPNNLFLDQSSISSLEDLINRNLKLGVLNINAHIEDDSKN